jgi:hypothetical protein
VPPLRQGSGKTLGRPAMPARLSIFLLATMVMFVASCEQGSFPDEGSEPSHSSQNLSEGSGNNGQVGVAVRINHNPVISAMNAEWLGQNRWQLSAQVADRDGDPLGLAWSTPCAGGFDDSQAAQPILTFDLPLPSTCTIHLDVHDGQGGTHAGDLTLSLSPVEVESE